MKIKEWFIKVLQRTPCRDPNSDFGMMLILKRDFLKQNKNMKRYNVIAYGDTMEELHKNHKIMERDIIMAKSVDGLEVVN